MDERINVTMGKLNYRRAVCCYRHGTFSTNCVHSVSCFEYQTNWRSKVWNSSLLQTLSV